MVAKLKDPVYFPRLFYIKILPLIHGRVQYMYLQYVQYMYNMSRFMHHVVNVEPKEATHCLW
jgi:hypothetical protein